MKRIASIFLVILVLVTGMALFGCTAAVERDVLAHQQFPFRVTTDLTFGMEEYTVVLDMIAPMEATLSFIQPEMLEGYVFSISPEGVTLSFSDITIPYTSNSVPGGSLLIPQMFSLTPDQLINTTETEQNSVPLAISAFSTAYGEITLFINSNNGTLMRIESLHNDTPVVLRISSIEPIESTESAETE